MLWTGLAVNIHSMETEYQIAKLNRIRRLSRLMDSSIRVPLTDWRIGLDPILGLVPGIGDVLSTAVSAYIISLALRFKLPPTAIARMIFNVGLETVIGAVPLLGDIFDAYYKSNIRNLDILEKHIDSIAPEIEQKQSLC